MTLSKSGAGPPMGGAPGRGAAQERVTRCQGPGDGPGWVGRALRRPPPATRAGDGAPLPLLQLGPGACALGKRLDPAQVRVCGDVQRRAVRITPAAVRGRLARVDDAEQLAQREMTSTRPDRSRRCCPADPPSNRLATLCVRTSAASHREQRSGVELAVGADGVTHDDGLAGSDTAT